MKRLTLRVLAALPPDVQYVSILALNNDDNLYLVDYSAFERIIVKRTKMVQVAHGHISIHSREQCEALLKMLES